MKIISMDGGGIRGVLTARLLQRIEEQIPNLREEVTLYAGTSTGGILAAGLASGYKPADIVELYRKNAQRVFYNPWWRMLLGAFGVTHSKYPIDGLRAVAEEYFRGKTLEDLPKKVLISAFDLDGVVKVGYGRRIRQWKAKFFHNFPGNDSDGHELLSDVVIRTSAAPTFFPAYQGFVDGGVVAGNPAMAAIAQVLDTRNGGVALEDIRLFSLGTGVLPESISGDQNDWGLAQWATKITDMLLNGAASVTNFQCKQLLGSNFHRLDAIFTKNIEMDAADKVEELIGIADSVDISVTVNWLRTVFLK